MPKTHVCARVREYASCVCVCAAAPSQEIPDGGGTAEGKTVIIVGLLCVPVYLLTFISQRERGREHVETI